MLKSKMRWTAIAFVLVGLLAGAVQARPLEDLPQAVQRELSLMTRAWKFVLSLLVPVGEPNENRDIVSRKSGCTADPDGLRRCS